MLLFSCTLRNPQMDSVFFFPTSSNKLGCSTVSWKKKIPVTDILAMYSALRRSICSPSVAVPSNVMRGDRLPDAVRACVCLLLLIFLHKFLSVTCVLTGAYEGSQFHSTTAHVPRTLCESLGEFQRVQWRATGHALLWRKHCFVRVRHHLKVFKKKKKKVKDSS